MTPDMKKPANFRSPVSFSLLIFAVLVLAVFSSSNAQNKPERRLMEIPGDEYVPSPRNTHATSPAYSYRSQEIVTVQVNVDASGNNILDDAANEPSIAFDPTDPDKMAIGWRQFDNINNNFRQAGNAYSTDAGHTWTFPGVIDPGVFRSDPVLRNDGEGTFFYNSLTTSGNSYWTNVYKSEDGGSAWTMGTFAQGGDKQWMSVDRTDGIGAGNIYEFWTSGYSICAPYAFTRSTDGNVSYEPCTSIPGDPYWGTTIVGPDGTLYLCGVQQWGGFMVAKSSNARDPGQDVSWDFTVSVNLGGEIVGFGGTQCPNPDGLLGQTIIAVDSSGGPGNGNVYLLCSVATYVNSDPCDVMFARSTDGGLNWSAPVKINDDLGHTAYQWFGTMSVAPDGRIDVIWLDTRNNPGTVNSALYYSYSLDEGVTWTQNAKLSDAFNPHIGWPQQNKMGDYFDMYSDEAGAHLAWAATFNGEQDVYYSLITPSYVGLSDNVEKPSVSFLKNYPNPFKDKTTIRYRLSGEMNVLLKVFSMTGSELITLVNENQDPGIHQVVFNASGLESGVYYYQLKAGQSLISKRFILLK
jgi:hypothetical protein